MRSLAPALVHAVLQRLAGPMKRVTLAVWVDAVTTSVPLKALVPLRDVCTRMGFQRAAGGQDGWYLEVECAKQPQKARVKMVGSKTFENLKKQDGFSNDFQQS